MAYSDYLRSSRWRARRAAHLAKHPRCQSCGRVASQVHHVSYDRLGKERETDLKSVCIPCHSGEHPDKDMAGPGVRIAEPCPVCGGDEVRMFAVTTRRFYRCAGCQHGWTGDRPTLKTPRARQPMRRGKRQRHDTWKTCAWCGGTWPLKKHLATCVPAGVAIRRAAQQGTGPAATAYETEDR